MNKPVYLIAATVVAVSLGWVFIGDPPEWSVDRQSNEQSVSVIDKPVDSSKPSRSEAAIADGNRLDQLGNEVKKLRSKIERLERQVQILSEKQPIAELDGNDAIEVADAVEEEFSAINELENEDTSFESRISLLDQTVLQEPLDAKWSQMATDKIYAAFDGEPFAGIDLLDVDCRTSICRVQVATTDPKVQTEFQSSLAMQLGEVLPRMTTQQTQADDGTMNTLIFFAREGYRLPETDSDGGLD